MLNDNSPFFSFFFFTWDDILTNEIYDYLFFFFFSRNKYNCNIYILIMGDHKEK